ncbi:MAG: leucyl aminopeptidase [Alphaproteobacteria bacterium]|nr:MAG: leucyl aminopeptidase [Alphaproteobacteria bacterium]
MPSQNIKFFNPFITSKRKNDIIVTVITANDFDTWSNAQTPVLQLLIAEQGFKGKSGEILISRDEAGKTNTIIAGSSDSASFSDGSKIHDAIKNTFSEDSLKKTSFSIESNDLDKQQLERLHIGWALAIYKFSFYKKDKENKHAALCLSSNIDKKRIQTYVEGVCFIRDLVNIPANDMGPDELEAATKTLTKHHKVKLKVIKDNDLTDQNFPMIYEVGKASPRRPRLLDFTWGDEKNPKVTLVGKGVCFDTGGLDIKPSQFMLTMKKDMGGSAHVLGLAHMIMSLNLPIRLRVLIPAVENSIAGNAYRPSDIINSRKGITVEVGNTDAEGRLVLADALTYACEEKPELLIDFATLTGAARIALGYDIPAMFSNNDETAHSIQKLSATDDVDDAVWHLPLWKPYRKELDSPIADISSTGVGRAGATNAALFLQEFIDNDIEWLHMDVFSWEQNGKTGRPKGGADTGMRAIFAFLEERYGE